MRDKLILCFGGGRESVLTLHRLSNNFSVILLFFSYGQRSHKKDVESLDYYAKKYEAEKIIRVVDIDAPESIRVGGSETDFVPFRNHVFIYTALNIAHSMGVRHVSFGITRDADHVDTSPAFIRHVKKSLLQHNIPIRVHTPLHRIYPRNLHRHLIRENVDVSKVWSCNNDEDKACGKCYKCLELKKVYSAKKDRLTLQWCEAQGIKI